MCPLAGSKLTNTDIFKKKAKRRFITCGVLFLRVVKANKYIVFEKKSRQANETGNVHILTHVSILNNQVIDPLAKSFSQGKKTTT